jgi:hypothetical protein
MEALATGCLTASKYYVKCFVKRGWCNPVVLTNMQTPERLGGYQSPKQSQIRCLETLKKSWELEKVTCIEA